MRRIIASAYRQGKHFLCKPAVFVSLGFFLLGYFFFVAAPYHFAPVVVKIEQGSSLLEVSRTLADAKAIRSPMVFRAVIILGGNEQNIKAGTYMFGMKDDVFRVSHKVVRGDYGVPVVRITITEGMNSRDIAKLFTSTHFPYLSKDELTPLLSSYEGYVFPDTYFVPVSTTAEELLDMFTQNFEKKAGSVLYTSSSTQPLADVITMASIIEGEANNDIDRKIISGILWKRIMQGMPLQVDTTFVYIMNKGSFELSREDLATTSPYNTYVHKGLPPGPINNPGIASISAALYPTSSPYLFYLSDSNGKMYYAKTFEEHVANKRKYLSQ